MRELDARCAVPRRSDHDLEAYNGRIVNANRRLVTAKQSLESRDQRIESRASWSQAGDLDTECAISAKVSRNCNRVGASGSTASGERNFETLNRDDVSRNGADVNGHRSIEAARHVTMSSSPSMLSRDGASLCANVRSLSPNSDSLS